VAEPRPAQLRLPFDAASALRVWQRNFWVHRSRWAYAIVPNFFEPVFYLLGLGIGLGFYVTTGGQFEGGYLAFIAPGLVAAAAMNGASFEATYNVFLKLHYAKLYDAMIATRVNIEDVVVGELLWATTRATVYGGVFLFITLFFDTPVTLRLLPALGAIVLVGFCFATIGLAFTATIRVIDVFSYYFTLFLTPSFLFSDIFFPVSERFPPALVAVAQWTPLYRSVQLVRGAVTGDAATAVLDIAYLLGVGVLLGGYAMWRMRRQVVR
jgi:lipooligosaccharide transport system permease protein